MGKGKGKGKGGGGAKGKGEGGKGQPPKAGSGGGKGGGGGGGGKAGAHGPPVRVQRNVSFAAAIKAAKRTMIGGDRVEVGRKRCPRVRLLARPAYSLFAQIHRNRLAGMLMTPQVLSSLSMICVIGSQPEPSSGSFGLRGQQSAGNEVWYSKAPYMDAMLQEEFEMPAVLRRIRQVVRNAADGRRTQVVIYSNPRGSNPTGVDTCTSYRELERAAWAGSGAMSWSEAGVLDDALAVNGRYGARWKSHTHTHIYRYVCAYTYNGRYGA